MNRTCAAFVTLAGLTTGACHAQSPSDAEALTQVRAAVDGIPVCAPLVSGSWPIEFSAEALATPGIDALVAAGLVKRVALPNPTKERERVRIEPASTGESDVRLFRINDKSPPQPQLCFGHKQVESVRVEPDGGTGQRLRYTYRIVGAPAWTARPDIRAAYPFLAPLLDKPQLAREAAFLEKGQWQFPGKADRSGNGDLEITILFK